MTPEGRCLERLTCREGASAEPGDPIDAIAGHPTRLAVDATKLGGVTSVSMTMAITPSKVCAINSRINSSGAEGCIMCDIRRMRAAVCALTRRLVIAEFTARNGKDQRHKLHECSNDTGTKEPQRRCQLRHPDRTFWFDCSISAIRPLRSITGEGGQPGMCRSTGRTSDTPSMTA